MQSPAAAASLPESDPVLRPGLRPVGVDDQPFLRTLYRSTREAELATVPWTDAQKAAFSEMQFNAQTAGYRHTYPEAEHLLICAPGGERAGRLIKARLEAALQLVDIALLPAYRGLGWGTALIAAMQRDAAEARVPMLLSVEKHNRARVLYERLGFSISGELEMHFTMIWKA